MKVEQIMTRPAWTCRFDQTVADAAQVMKEHGVGCVPVVDGDGRPTGIVTDRDLLLAALARGEPLASIKLAGVMQHRVHAVRPSDTVWHAEEVMRARRVRRLPVIEASGRIAGMISIDDIVREVEREAKGRSQEITPAELARTMAEIAEPKSLVAPAR